jgi:hypothetical protein
VKSWIALGSLVVGIGAIAVRSNTSNVPIQERLVEVPVRVEVPVEVPKIVEKVRVETRMIERQVPAVAAPERPAGTYLAHEKMLFLFERELELRADQRRFMEEVLAHRELEIAEHQRSIVDSRIFRVGEYENWVRATQAASYEKMAEVLDETQRRRFAGLLAEGRLGDAVMFEVPPTMVVLQN